MPKIIQFKISLEEIEPKIWRKFLIYDDITFEKLHEIIQKLMSWENYHLWSFKINKKEITPENEENGNFNPAEDTFKKLFSSPEFIKMLEEQNLSKKGGVALDVNKINAILEKTKKDTKNEHPLILTKVDELINKKGQKFQYIYDFGDSWKHTLIVEKIFENKEKYKQIPICLEGERACPPEDCGGIWGYGELIEIKKDKKHPDYEERIKNWLGEDFNFEEFNIERINEKLL